jgi:hypothetical protein
MGPASSVAATGPKLIEPDTPSAAGLAVHEAVPRLQFSLKDVLPSASRRST